METIKLQHFNQLEIFGKIRKWNHCEPFIYNVFIMNPVITVNVLV